MAVGGVRDYWLYIFFVYNPGAIFLHCIPTCRPYLDDPPSISEGWGGRITDYRISVSHGVAYY